MALKKLYFFKTTTTKKTLNLALKKLLFNPKFFSPELQAETVTITITFRLCLYD